MEFMEYLLTVFYVPNPKNTWAEEINEIWEI